MVSAKVKKKKDAHHVLAEIIKHLCPEYFSVVERLEAELDRLENNSSDDDSALDRLDDVIDELRELNTRAVLEIPWLTKADQETLKAAFGLIASLQQLSEESLRAKLDDLRWEAESQHAALQDVADADRFFSRKKALADFCYWAARPTWEIAEAVALSLGKDPRVVTEQNIAPIKTGSPFARQFIDRLDQLRRAKLVNDLMSHARPADYLRWFATNDVGVPQGLVDATRERERRKVASNRPDLTTKERHTLLKIIYISLSLKDPKLNSETISRRVKELCGRAPELGLKADDETVRNYLKAAVKYAEQERGRPKK